jgi:membrane associated rhomboid family serine protease
MGSSPSSPGLPTHSPEIASEIAPEILLPESERDAPQEQQRADPEQRSESEQRSWAYAPATYVLVAINCLVFVAMLLHHFSIWNPTPDQLLLFGANQPRAVLLGGQWQLVVTAMFVHVGIVHLATNMWCLWNLGLLGEPLIGPFGVFAAYVLSGAAGNLLSIGVNMLDYTSFPQNSADLAVGAGASGAVFGLAGVLIVLLKSPLLKIDPKELKSLRRLVIYFAAVNFVIGFGGNKLSNYFDLGMQVDNMAHLGGFLGGILFALPLVPLLGASRQHFLIRRRIAVGLVTSVLVFFGVYLTSVFPGSTWTGK